ncbi:CCA tRNA nucleotidyltransferase [Candidatus Falkowbacteria bacterium]|nr:CCA tRNA nucleotidyltransferase [Candidatus Falkowbacteria bacterium]
MNTSRLKTFTSQLKKSGILNFLNDLPENAEIYLVGGTVRDIIIGRQNPGDLDLVVRNVEIKLLEKILKKHGKVNFVGKNFGIFKFQPKTLVPSSVLRPPSSESIDIALPRTEHSFGTGAYKDFKVTFNHRLPIKKDLSRRDFTINAIAYQLSTINNQQSQVIDPCNGLRDLQRKLIRTVNNPRTRFKEDYSRILRAVRIACELGFKIEKNTLQAIKKQIPHINDLRKENKESKKFIRRSPEQRRMGEGGRLVPYEIIASEILKSFQASPVRTLELLDETGALRELMPELLTMKNCPQPEESHSEGDVWTHAKLALSLINSPRYKKEFGANDNDVELILAALFHDIGKPATINIVNNKIQFHGHSQAGDRIIKKICTRLKLQSVPGFNLKCQNLVHLVSKHMLRLFERVNQLKDSTVAKYFLIDSKTADKLLKLFWLDSMASIPNKGKPDLSGFKELKQRVTALTKQSKITKEKPLLTGNEIMKKFKLKPGPKIGQLLATLHEAYLSDVIKTKSDAITFIKRELK